MCERCALRVWRMLQRYSKWDLWPSRLLSSDFTWWSRCKLAEIESWPTRNRACRECCRELSRDTGTFDLRDCSQMFSELATWRVLRYHAWMPLSREPFFLRMAIWLRGLERWYLVVWPGTFLHKNINRILRGRGNAIAEIESLSRTRACRECCRDTASGYLWS
jgi:hypothetical protein